MPYQSTIFTIGHSTHPIDEFIGLLKEHNIELLTDIRTLPRSRFNPQFNGDALAKSLRESNLEYLHMKDLGGMRKPRKDSINQGLISEGFRGYADYMQTENFKNALKLIIEISAKKCIVTMCAEAKPSMCHRQILADAILARGFEVMHILPDGNIKPHQYTEFAVASGHEVTYPLPLFA